MTGVTATWPPNREVLATRMRSQTRLFGTLLVAAVLLSVFIQLPWRLTGLPFALATIVVGFRLLFTLAAWRRSGGSGGGFLGVSVGLGLAAVLAMYTGVQLALYPTIADLERCQTQASTIAAKEACAEQFRIRPGG